MRRPFSWIKLEAAKRPDVWPSTSLSGDRNGGEEAARVAEEEPKIIIDEGWKAQVERERKEAKKQAEETHEDAGDDLAEAGMSLFDYLVSTLAAQTMISLGLVAEEGQDKIVVDLGTANHLIDSLMMLREKTQGNLTADEAKNLTDAVSELQRVFAPRAQQAREAAMQKPGIDPNPPELDR